MKQHQTEVSLLTSLALTIGPKLCHSKELCRVLYVPYTKYSGCCFKGHKCWQVKFLTLHSGLLLWNAGESVANCHVLFCLFQTVFKHMKAYKFAFCLTSSHLEMSYLKCSWSDKNPRCPTIWSTSHPWQCYGNSFHPVGMLLSRYTLFVGEGCNSFIIITYYYHDYYYHHYMHLCESDNMRVIDMLPTLSWPCCLGSACHDDGATSAGRTRRMPEQVSTRTAKQCPAAARWSAGPSPRLASGWTLVNTFQHRRQWTAKTSVLLKCSINRCVRVCVRVCAFICVVCTEFWKYGHLKNMQVLRACSG